MHTLHITNGDVTVDLFKKAEIRGEYLPWRDVLHMGPVPAELRLQELSKVRAKFIASLGWGEQSQLENDFKSRDHLLTTANTFNKVLLWFEHDLYDQLQLIQILDWFSKQPDINSRLFLINTSQHLGRHSPEEIKALLSTQQPVTQVQLDLAASAWAAYRQEDLSNWAALIKSDTSSLPFLKAAIARSLGEVPDHLTGLTLTETMILILVAEGANQAANLFKRYCQKEDNEFHGDTGFLWYVQQMIEDTPALLTLRQGKYALTEQGKLVLSGKQTWQRQYSKPHWLGGYCISSPQ